jgi:hypothetical protein
LDADFGPDGSPFSFDELNSYDHLFLTECSEPEANTLRLVIREGRRSRISVLTRVAGVDFGEGFPVEIDDSCATFVLEWNDYVLYQVLNDMFGKPSHSSEVYEGKLARKYSASKLLQFVLETTHASDEYPGKLIHFGIICEHNIIDVICVTPPLCWRSGPSFKLQ